MTEHFKRARSAVNTTIEIGKVVVITSADAVGAGTALYIWQHPDEAGQKTGQALGSGGNIIQDGVGRAKDFIQALDGEPGAPGNNNLDACHGHVDLILPDGSSFWEELSNRFGENAAGNIVDANNITPSGEISGKPAQAGKKYRLNCP